MTCVTRMPGTRGWPKLTKTKAPLDLGMGRTPSECWPNSTTTVVGSQWVGDKFWMLAWPLGTYLSQFWAASFRCGGSPKIARSICKTRVWSPVISVDSRRWGNIVVCFPNLQCVGVYAQWFQACKRGRHEESLPLLNRHQKHGPRRCTRRDCR